MDSEGDRRRRFVDVICLGTDSRWLGLRPEEEDMNSRSRRNSELGSKGDHLLNAAGLRAAQGEGKAVLSVSM